MPDQPIIGHAQNQLTVSVDNIHANTTQNLITITEDRLELRLRDYKEKMDSRQDLLGPLGICVSLVVTLITATFNDTLGVPKQYIHGTFITATLASFIWLLVSFFKNRQTNEVSIKALIEEIRS